MRTFLSLVCVLVLSVSVAVSGEKLVAGTNAEFPPFEFTDNDNKIVGFDIDIITAVGKSVGYDVEMRHQVFDTLIESLESKKIDVAISGMTITDARREKVDFSDPYYDAAQVIVVREADAGYTAMDQLKDKKVGVQLGTTGALMSEEVLGENNENLRQFRRYTEVFNELRLRRIDAVVVDLPVAKAFIRRIKGLKISSQPMSEEQYGIAVKKGNAELLKIINEGLLTIRESGEYDRITEKWFQD